MKKDLAQLIRENPGAYFEVDNDCWAMWSSPPPPFDASDEALDEWRDAKIATDGDVIGKGDGGYGSGCTYGGDILQALAEIVGVTVESV